jgi:hypothetical protein
MHAASLAPVGLRAVDSFGFSSAQDAAALAAIVDDMIEHHGPQRTARRSK